MNNDPTNNSNYDRRQVPNFLRSLGNKVVIAIDSAYERFFDGGSMPASPRLHPIDATHNNASQE